MSRILITALLAAGLLSACGDPLETARQGVIDSLHTSGEFTFHDLRQYPGGVVCGDYVQMDKWGQSAGRRPFIHREGATDVRPGRDKLAVLCSETPARALAEHMGVSFDEAGMVARVTHDFALLAQALEAYYQDNTRYPDSEQGLTALVAKPERGHAPRNYREGGYLETIPDDPWGRPYRYEGPAWGRVKTPYRLWTAGADGEAGGDGMARDLDVTLLPLLEHVAALHQGQIE